MLSYDTETLASPTYSLNTDFARSEQERKTSFLRKFCLVLGGLLTTIIPPYLVLGFVFGELVLTMLAVVCFVSAATCLVGYRLAGQGYYRVASWLLIASVLSALVYGCWLAGTGVLITMGFVVPVALTIMLMSASEMIVVSIFCAGFVSFMYAAQYLLKIYQPPVVLPIELQTGLSIFCVVLTFLAIPIVLALPIGSQLRAMREQNRHLQIALGQLVTRQHNSQEVSQQVLSLATTLTSTASQQASGSQKQVFVVEEVNTSMAELSSAAHSIDELAGQVSRSAGLMAGDSRQIEQTTLLAVEKGELGLAVVERTVTASQEVAALYQQLVVIMTALNDKSANMRLILDLLGSIANETHLLALNAAIEAAGAGEYGQRFGVVAQEVKNLAGRSAVASRKVFEKVLEVETATQEAVRSAQDGYAKAIGMQEVSSQTGQLIGEMCQVVGRCQAQADSISTSASGVQELLETIRAATTQQRSASQQVLAALQSLSNVAQQSAKSSQLVSATADDLEELSQNLNLALAA